MTEPHINCHWENCSKRATIQLFSSDEKQQAWLCSEHRRAAMVNLEQYNAFFAPKTKKMQGARPGAPPPMAQITPSARPGQLDSNQTWEQKAARQADAAAKPVEQPKPEPPKQPAQPKRISHIPTQPKKV